MPLATVFGGLLRRPYHHWRRLRERRNFEYQFHRRSDLLRAFPTALSVGTDPGHDGPLIDRIVAAYRRSPPLDRAGNSMWDELFDQYHGEIHAAFMTGQRQKVERILRNPASSDLLLGFESLSSSLISRHRLAERNAPALALDGLLRLAEALGVRRLENPETYSRARQVAWNPDRLLGDVEAALGVTLPLPNPFPGEYGAAMNRGVLSYRVPQALYQAWRLRELTAATPHPRILEVGGGLGRTALYAQALGLTDYTIVDLPLTAVAQAYFLCRTLGAERVTVDGEPRLRGAVSLQSPTAFHADDRTYDIVINADSLTEMSEATARHYWSAFSHRTSRLFSTNHEANALTVRTLIASSGPGVRSTRCPSWMRHGYVEEVVEFAHSE
jgi:hypothetical protein